MGSLNPIIDYLKTLEGLDFDLPQAKTPDYQNVMQLLGLDKEQSTERSINHRLNHLMHVCERHLASESLDNDIEERKCWGKVTKELQSKYKIEINTIEILGFVTKLLSARCQYWKNNNRYEIPDQILMCNIDLVILQVLRRVNIFGSQASELPAEIQNHEFVIELIRKTRLHRSELVEAAEIPPDIDISGLLTAEGNIPTQLCTEEENMEIFYNPELNEMIHDLEDMLCKDQRSNLATATDGLS